MPDERHEPVNEYEREPMPEKTRLGSKSFIGQYAGKHTADTELRPGPLFVAACVSASDLIMGLRAGNLLAVSDGTQRHARPADGYHSAGHFLSERQRGSRRGQDLDVGCHRRVVGHGPNLEGPPNRLKAWRRKLPAP